jgi:molecular chaperone IbpA
MQQLTEKIEGDPMFASIYYPFHSALKPRSERGAFGRQENQKDNNSPPFNLNQLSDHQFQIDLLVAGYQESEIELSVEGKTLIVQGTPASVGHQAASVEHQAAAAGSQPVENANPKPNFLRQEWAVLPFKKLFSLEAHLQVEGAKLSQGVLSIFLKREIPQEEKPKVIPIHTVKN